MDAMSPTPAHAPMTAETAPAAPPSTRSRIVEFFRGRTLAECIDARRDNILELRLFAAIIVIFGHSFVLLPGVPTRLFDPLQWLLPHTQSHLAGVMMFFTISGFLITMSFERRPDVLRYVAARLLRLWPALAVCVVLLAYVFGPIVTTSSLHDYFTVSGPFGTPWHFTRSNASLIDVFPFLPGVFPDNPVAHFVDASLWTIPVEARMYLCVLVGGVIGAYRFPRLTTLVIAAIFGWLVVWPMATGTVKAVGTSFFSLQLMGFFGAGAIAYLWRHTVRVSSGIMLAILALAIAMRLSTHAWWPLALAIGYFVLWFAYVPRVPKVPGQWDLSYGTYLYAFPVQQTLIMLGVRNPLLVFVLATPIVLLIATASWHWVEKPCLRLKRFRRPRATSAPATV
jgi:peptidoglycan/LPS O-acetylase OafA/YrhL